MKKEITEETLEMKEERKSKLVGRMAVATRIRMGFGVNYFMTEKELREEMDRIYEINDLEGLTVNNMAHKLGKKIWEIIQENKDLKKEYKDFTEKEFEKRFVDVFLFPLPYVLQEKSSQ